MLGPGTGERNGAYEKSVPKSHLRQSMSVLHEIKGRNLTDTLKSFGKIKLGTPSGSPDQDGDAGAAPPDMDSSVEPGVWRYAMARRASVIVDAADYFVHMQQAMLNAQKRIMLIGWDFDTRVHLAIGRRWYHKLLRHDCPIRLGSFIPWLVRHRPGLEVLILKWGYGLFSFFTRGLMLVDILRWMPNRRIKFNFDSAHPFACSHHQKIAIIDDALAVCGGIDMTAGRWDTREHVSDDPRRGRPPGPYYAPWHDVTMMMEGDVAELFGWLGRDRWSTAGGNKLPSLAPRKKSIWPERLQAQFENAEIGIARTRAAYKGRGEIREIEELYCRQIARAKRFIYAESQYFASRKIADAIVRRVNETNPPEIIIINPLSADGWLEQQAMDHSRNLLLRAIGDHDHLKRFHMYVAWSEEEPIYVHAKLMIVDDEIIRIGSANLNNRSMGLDSECDVFIDCARPANAHCSDAIRAIRLGLLGEHCGKDPDEIAQLIDQHGSIKEMIEKCPASERRLERLELPELSDFERDLANKKILDPESPEEMFEPIARRNGLLRRGSILRQPTRRGFHWPHRD